MRLSTIAVYLCVLAAAFSSCTIRKRVHLPGFHIEWNGEEARIAKPQNTSTTVQVSEEEASKKGIAVLTDAAEFAVVSNRNEHVTEKLLKDEGIAPQVKQSPRETQKDTPLRVHFPTRLFSPVQTLQARVGGDETTKTDGMSIASMVCGIVGMFMPLLVLPILAIIFAGVGLHRIKMNPDLRGKGMAVTGLVLGILGFLCSVLFIAVLVASL
jgi:Domain of unknown function (DUF4190)